MAGFLRAAELPSPVTLDLPIPANLATPSWLGHPETPATAFPSLNLPILTPDTTASLLVTVYFQEKQGGFLRIIWNGTQGAELLSDNFYEDIGMANQRSLLISPAMLVGDGTLTFQCDDAQLGIQRIKLEWLANKNALISPSLTDTLVKAETGPTQLAFDLNGLKNPTEPGVWVGQVVSVSIADQATRIEQGVEFSVDLDKVPTSARLSLKETGLPLGKHLVVWVNQHLAGTITPAVPDLKDAGYLPDASATTGYVGWRDGSFYVPVSLLIEGVNTLQLSDEDDGDPQATGSAPAPELPLAVKTMALQLNYANAEEKATFLTPQLTLHPDGPINSTDTTSTPTDSTTP